MRSFAAIRGGLALGLVLGLALPSTSVHAGGPQAVATIDRALWPHPLTRPRDFDRASFAENVVFASVYFAGADPHPKKESLAQWQAMVEEDLLRNLTAASRGCGPDCKLNGKLTRATLPALVDAQAKRLEAEMPEWFAAARTFHQAYFNEQRRLASLFPSPSSEILKFGDGEWIGRELEDRTFLLTFDDGPTPAGGHTDELTKLLRTAGVSAMFFVLHDPLQRRLDKPGRVPVAQLYAQHCLAVHGKEHRPHPALPNWKESISETQALVASVVGPQEKLRFRPPYGQRNREIVDFVTGQGGAVVLWNIDSQDWHPRIQREQAFDRVLTLMLLRRRGIILFHDTHDKASAALPGLLDVSHKIGVQWQSCHAL